MQIIKEKTPYHEYAWGFNYTPSIVDFCRSLKDKYGWKEFTFYNGKWRFKDVKIVNDIIKSYPEASIDAIIKIDMKETTDLEKRKEEIEDTARKLKEIMDTDFVVDNVKGELYP